MPTGSQLAPVAVFAFRRPGLTRELLESLRRNPEIAETDVTVFVDGPRNEDEARLVQATCEAVLGSDIPSLRLVRRDRNLGLSESVRAGVTELCEVHGRVVVLEDDLVVSSTFLRYMNAALDRYADAEDVMHVTGFMYNVTLPTALDAAAFPAATPWGWATWKRAWRHYDHGASRASEVLDDPYRRHEFSLHGSYDWARILELDREGRVSSWDARWYLSMFLRGGMQVAPSRSLVENRGFGEGATHTDEKRPAWAASKAQEHVVTRWPEPALDQDVLQAVEACLKVW
jgi:hypothetical protein